MKSKYLWFTDLHLNRVSPIKKVLFINHIIKEKPKAIFLTGDISNGMILYYDLYLLARFIKCPIYFILGNHDYWNSSIEKTHNKVKLLCDKFPNLIWLSEQDFIELNEDVAVIGDEGWFDGRNGNTDYLKLTVDQYFIEDFRHYKSMDEKLEHWRKMSFESSLKIKDKLQKALNKGYKTVYILTHFPPWVEATRARGTFLEKFWLPYNTNVKMGQTIEQVMKNRLKSKVIVLCGHIHADTIIHVSSNIECKVNKDKIFGWLRNEELLFI